jgi:hypothetical protein
MNNVLGTLNPKRNPALLPSTFVGSKLVREKTNSNPKESEGQLRKKVTAQKTSDFFSLKIWGNFPPKK